MNDSANKSESLVREAPETVTGESIDELPDEIKNMVRSDEAEVEKSIAQDEMVIVKDVNIAARDVEIGLAITAGLSLVIALVVFFGVTMKRKMPKSGFMRYLREFLNFRKIWVAGILKFVYIFLAAGLTIGSIVMMFYGGDRVLEFVLLGLFIIVFGNILLRIGFEMTMITIGLWENTRDIRGVLVKNEDVSEEKPRKLDEDDLMEMEEEVEEVEEVEEPEE